MRNPRPRVADESGLGIVRAFFLVPRVLGRRRFLPDARDHVLEPVMLDAAEVPELIGRTRPAGTRYPGTRCGIGLPIPGQLGQLSEHLDARLPAKLIVPEDSAGERVGAWLLAWFLTPLVLRCFPLVSGSDPVGLSDLPIQNS
jgi:hypothetical protein